MLTHSAARVLARLNRVLQIILEWSCVVGVTAVVLSIIYQVLTRYLGLQVNFLFGGAPWAEEAALLFFVWVVTIGNALAIRENAHLFADILPETLGELGDKVAALAVDLVNFVLAGTFLIWGYLYADEAWVRFSQVLSYPMFYMFLSIPLTAFITMLFVVERIMNTWVAK